MDLENTVLVISPDVFLIDGCWHAKRAEEFTPGTFAAMLGDTRPGTIASHRQPVIVDTNIKRRAIDTRQINRHRVLVFIFVNVRRWIPIRAFNFIALVGLTRAPLCSVFE